MLSRLLALCLGLSAGLLVAACGASRTSLTCTVANCAGCCDELGECRDGATAQACGQDGKRCSICGFSEVCSLGHCVEGSGGGGSTGGGAGGFGGAGTGGGAGGGFAGTLDGGAEDCSEAARLVYVVDQNKTLSSFDPRKTGSGDGFIDLGKLSCPSAPLAEPFSMSVDRQAVAWIVYDSGELFTVDLRVTPLSCVKTGFMPQQGVGKFGMGFVADVAGSHEETLFISGSPLVGSLLSTKFGTLSTTPPFEIALRGTLDGAPELTGTGDAKLWGFFPDSNQPRVVQLDKETGKEMSPSFAATPLTGFPLAWAFAFWGGDFWIFLERDVDPSTNVWRLNGQTGAITNVSRDTGRRIVGAGVSTCAPVTIN
ncbi:MAG: hypothetical protein AB1938_23315 [Myxococcota bacterium]